MMPKDPTIGATAHSLVRGFPRTIFGVKAFATCAAVFGVLALIKLNRYGLDGDEATSRWLATMPLADMFAYLRLQDKVFALYYVVLHFWALGGHGVAYLRASSLAFAAGSLALVYRTATALFDRTFGFWSAVLLASSFLFIVDADRIRAEIMMLFFCVLAARCAVENMQKKDARSAWGFALSAVAAIFAHPMACAWVTALAAGAVLFGGKGAAARLAPPFAAVGVFGLAPLAWFTVLDRYGAQIAWIGPLSVGKIAVSLLYFSGGGSIAAALVLAGLVGVGIFKSGGREGARNVLLFWLAAAFGIVLAISRGVDVIQPYYYLYCWIPVSILGGAALASARRAHARYAGGALVAVFVALNAYQIAYNPWRREDFQAAAAFLHGRVAASDAIVVHAAYYARALYYALQAQGDERYLARFVYPRRPFREFRQDPPAALARRVGRNHSDVWLVLSHASLSRFPAVARLIARYPRRAAHTFAGVRVVHLWRGEPLTARRRADSSEKSARGPARLRRGTGRRARSLRR